MLLACQLKIVPYSTMMTIESETPTIGKREERRLERRRAILAVAANSFLENGYAGTTMSAISAKLGGSKGTLWNHFNSKEELFAAFLDETTGFFKQELMTVLEPSRDLRPALETFARRFMEKISSPVSIKLYRLVVGESGRSPEVGRMFYARAPGAVEAILARFLDDHMKAGNLQTGDPIRAARFLLGQCVGGGHQQMLCGGPAIDTSTIKQDAVRLTDQFLQLYSVDARSTSHPLAN
jgi:TetR/AcrR family transcriptional repressor of mexJK operon